ALIPAFILANFGKFLFSEKAISFAGHYRWIVLSLGPGIMGLGFAWLIYISLKNDSVGRIIGNKPMAWFGKISYSFYLWHSFILTLVYAHCKNSLTYGSLNPVILFVATLIILIPISYLSYLVFERFYFIRKSH